VGGHDRWFFFSRRSFVDDVVDFAADLGVEAGGGFVEEEHARVVTRAMAKREALFLGPPESLL